MKNFLLILFIAIITIACNNQKTKLSNSLSVAGPIQLHPDNQHYFLFKGKPLAIISSGEHYGAVINLDFDYKKYLKTLSVDGMNYTRIFTGAYFEAGGEYFGIQHNTLGVAPDKIITPWNKINSDTSIINKYDLTIWNDAYFKRLKDFMEVATEYNIIVEVTLFSSYYGNMQWEISPLNPVNNINLSNEFSFKEAQILKDTLLFKFQESYVRKMVNELNEYDNLFFEIQNEPWADHLDTIRNNANNERLNVRDSTLKANFANEKSLQWQKQITSIIVDEEKSLAKKHLIAQNYADFKNYNKIQSVASLWREREDLTPQYKFPVPAIDDNISVIIFHYAGPETVEWNYHNNKVIGFDESGFAGTEDIVYRRQAWRFMLSGGGLFNNLDYSFFVGNENGLGKNKAPGGGSKELRNQLKTLSDFLHGFELTKLHPNHSCIISVPELVTYVLSDKNSSYAIFVESVDVKSSTLQIKTDDGNYKIQTLNTITGLYSDPIITEAINGILNIEIEISEGELALKIKRLS